MTLRRSSLGSQTVFGRDGRIDPDHPETRSPDEREDLERSRETLELLDTARLEAET